MTDIVTYPSDDALREHVLTTDELIIGEMTYPGCIRILASGRYHARIEVMERVWNFSIKEVGSNEREFVADYPEDTPPLLLDLAWHRAAEAMLAHRKGHSDAYRNKLLRKPLRQEA